ELGQGFEQRSFESQEGYCDEFVEIRHDETIPSFGVGCGNLHLRRGTVSFLFSEAPTRVNFTHTKPFDPLE
ncbi:MAG: hypothetical protein ACM3XN_06085, partial [Chloroflexota bacterium]